MTGESSKTEAVSASAGTVVGATTLGATYARPAMLTTEFELEIGRVAIASGHLELEQSVLLSTLVGGPGGAWLTLGQAFSTTSQRIEVLSGGLPDPLGQACRDAIRSLGPLWASRCLVIHGEWVMSDLAAQKHLAWMPKLHGVSAKHAWTVDELRDLVRQLREHATLLGRLTDEVEAIFSRGYVIWHHLEGKSVDRFAMGAGTPGIPAFPSVNIATDEAGGLRTDS